MLDLHIFKDVSRLIFFFRRMKVDMRYFVASAFILGVLVFFYVYAIQLLYTLINGIIQNDFETVRNMRGPAQITRLFPALFESSQALFILLVIWNYLVALIRNVLQYLGMLTVTYQANQASSRIRSLLFDRYLQFGKMFFDRSNVASLNQVIVSSTSTMTSQVTTVHQLLSQLVTLLVYIVMMFRISWKLTLAVVIIFPLMNSLSGFAISKLREKSVNYQKSLNQLNAKVFNILSCIPLVKGYGKEKHEKKYFTQASDREVKTALSMNRLEQLIPPIQDMSQVTALLLAAWTLAFIAAKDQALNVSGVLVFFYLANRSVPVFNVFNTFKLSLAGLEGPIQMIEDLLDDQDKYIVPEGDESFKGLEKEIRFKNLNFSYYKEIPVLKNVNLSIQKGEMTAIVGHTGAGKTTMMNLLLRFYDCPASSIFLDDQDIRSFRLEFLRNHMAFVSQEAFIFNDTIRANITYAVANENVSENQIIEVLKKARLYDFVMSLPDKLETIVGDRGVKLSGGEKQRISLARALLRDAEILILDEATSSLDSVTEKLIQQALTETTQGRTSLVIAHRLSTIKHADKVVVVEQGSIVEEGPPSELLSQKGKFHEFWQMQRLSVAPSQKSKGTPFVSFTQSCEPAYSKACELAASNEKAFGKFRREIPFTGIYENLSEDRIRKSMELAVTLDPDIVHYFKKFQTADQYGGPILYDIDPYGKFSGSLTRYIHFLVEIKKIFGSLNGARIVEIGGGYGGQAKVLLDYFQISEYTFVDIPPALALTERYMKNFSYASEIKYLNSKEIKPHYSYDLVISNYAFSALPRSTQKEYLDKVLKNSQKGFLKCNFMFDNITAFRYSKKELLTAIQRSKEELHQPEAPGTFTWVWGNQETLNAHTSRQQTVTA